MWREVNDAIDQLSMQHAAVGRRHVRYAPREVPEACLVQRAVGTSCFGVFTLPILALRALAWVIAEERRFVIRCSDDELAASLGSLNDAEFSQDDALWFLSRAITLLDKLRDVAADGETPKTDQAVFDD